MIAGRFRRKQVFFFFHIISVLSTRRQPAHPMPVLIFHPRDIQALWYQHYDTGSNVVPARQQLLQLLLLYNAMPLYWALTSTTYIHTPSTPMRCDKRKTKKQKNTPRRPPTTGRFTTSGIRPESIYTGAHFAMCFSDTLVLYPTTS